MNPPATVYFDGSKWVVEIREHAAELQGAITVARPMGRCETKNLIVVVHGKPATPQPEHVPAEEL